MKCKECGKENKKGVKKCLNCKNYLGICPHCLEESTFISIEDKSFKEYCKGLVRNLRYTTTKVFNLEFDTQEGYIDCLICKEGVVICTECFSPMFPTQTRCKECGFVRTIGVQKLLQAFKGFRGRR